MTAQICVQISVVSGVEFSELAGLKASLFLYIYELYFMAFRYFKKQVKPIHRKYTSALPDYWRAKWALTEGLNEKYINVDGRICICDEIYHVTMHRTFTRKKYIYG